MIDGEVRRMSRQILSDIVAAQGITDPATLRKAQREAYPFEQRSGWYYRIWREEVKRMCRILGEPQPTTPLAVRQHWIKGE